MSGILLIKDFWIGNYQWYGNLRKRSEEGKIIFTFIFDYFYCYCFHFFDYRYHFYLDLNIRKKLKNDFRKSKIIILFSSLTTTHRMLWSVDHPSNPSLTRCPASARGEGRGPHWWNASSQSYWATGARTHVSMSPAPSPWSRPSAGRPGTQPPFPAFNCQNHATPFGSPDGARRHPRFSCSPAIANGRTVPIDWALPPRVRAPYHGPA